MIPEANSILAALADAGGFLDQHGMYAAIAEFGGADVLDALENLHYVRRYTVVDADTGALDLFMLTAEGRAEVPPPFRFDADAARAWLLDTGGGRLGDDAREEDDADRFAAGDPPAGSDADELGLDRRWALIGFGNSRINAAVTDLDTALRNAPEHVFTARAGYILGVTPAEAGCDYRYAPLVWLPDKTMLTVGSENTRTLIPQDPPAAGDDYPGVTRAVAAMTQLVSFGNDIVAEALAARAVR